MNPERWQRLKELFHRAVQLPAGERAAFVRSECADDTALITEVESLLEADASAGSFLAAPAALPSDARPVPDAVGPFEISGVLGRGGMGVVYRARHRQSGREVALKTVATVDERLLGSIRREISALAQLDHRGVVSILDHGVHQGTPWYAMDLVIGQDLRSYCHAHPSLTAALTVMRQLAETLRHLHGQGVVHGDLKPGNVVVNDQGIPVLVDFGLMTRFGGRVDLGGYSLGPEPIGTAAYMAPEQARGQPLDARADLFAFGCILRELTAEHAAPPELSAVLQGLLATELRDRIGYADDVVRTLAVLGAGEPSVAVGSKSYLYRPSMAGRAEAAGVFQELLQTTHGGRGDLVFVVGESGIGKTRFVAEVGRNAQRMGLSFIAGECSPGRAAVPLAALSRPLQSLADRCRARGIDEGRRVFGDAARVLGDYVTGVGDVPGSLRGELDQLPADQARERIFDALTSVFERAAENGLVLAIDDLQWADDLTLGWLERMRERLRSRHSPLLVIGLYRVEEAGERLGRLAASRQHTLDRLDAGGVAQMVSDMLALQPAPEELVAFLTRHAEGNPFFVAEYLRSALDAGVLERDAMGQWSVERAYDAVQTPRPVRELVGLRLSGLSAAGRALVDAAAVLGRECSADALVAVAGDADALDSFAELRSRWVIDDCGDVIRFAHDKIREAAYERIAATRRSLLHHRAASFLEAAAPDQHAVIAQHWEQGDEPAHASRHYLAGARGAVERYAYGEAERLYRGCLRQDAAVGSEQVATRNELGADVLALRGDYLGARTEHAAALAEARRIGDRRGEAWSINRLASAELQLANIGAARAAFSESLSLFERLGDLSMQGTAHMNLALIDRDGGRLDDARYRLRHRALPLLRASGDTRGEAKALVHLAFIAWRCDALDEGVQLCEQALVLLQETGQRRWEGITRCVLGQLRAARGELDLALGAFDDALWIHLEVGDLSYQIESSYGRAGVLRRCGRLDEALEMAAAAESLCRQSGLDRDLILALCACGHVDLAQGRSAQPRIDEATALMSKLGFSKNGRHGAEVAELLAAQHAWSE